jgi:hypothetical protein
MKSKYSAVFYNYSDAIICDYLDKVIKQILERFLQEESGLEKTIKTIFQNTIKENSLENVLFPETRYKPETPSININNLPNIEDLINTKSKEYENLRSSYKPDSYPATVDSRGDAEVIYVPGSSLYSETLPNGKKWEILGMYDPNTHTIYIARDQSDYKRKFVYYHEIAHSKGIYNESGADAYATEKAGYNPLPNRLSEFSYCN